MNTKMLENYFDSNENEDPTYQAYRTKLKQSLEGTHI